MRNAQKIMCMAKIVQRVSYNFLPFSKSKDPFCHFGASCNLLSYLACDCVNGECDSGILGSGSCDCYSGWNGDRCDEGNDTSC